MLTFLINKIHYNKGDINIMEKIAIVTGGAKGIGREVVKTLAKKGIKVIANYNKSEKEAKELKDELENSKIYIDIFKADVSKREEVHELTQYVINKYGKINILVNNAGIAEYKLFTEETDEDWNRVINNNLYSTFVMCQEVLKSMIQQKEGCIINVSSIWGMVGASMEVIYSVSKAGIDGLTKALAKELGPSNIRVNSIAPGNIFTDMMSEFSEDEIEKLKNDTPLNKIGKTEDIAKCIAWLVDDNFTTGQVISINGGWVII